MITTFSKAFIYSLQINAGDLWFKVSYGQPGKWNSVSSYSDVGSVSPSVSEIHFRKFLNRKILLKILEKCWCLNKISISKSAYSRCDKKILDIIKQKGIKIKISRGRGRPNMMEMILW